VNILGCKRLNASDELILLRRGINVESGEDVFRFHLIPEYYSDLPRITNSVLKTRSTLSIHKVFKYLVKKLNETINNESGFMLTDISPQIIITCKGLQLDPSLQLRTAKQLHWPDDETLLTLIYKRKPTTLSRKPNPPARPPEWVPSHLAYNCRGCDSEFKFFFNSVHHCRNCGQCFCSRCSGNRIQLPNFGYTSPVRVCDLCMHSLRA
jgi:hypothetical protein